MASQIGDTREYTHVDEGSSPKLKLCPKCQVNAVPRGINDTRESASGEKHCPNCGHIYGRDNH